MLEVCIHCKFVTQKHGKSVMQLRFNELMYFCLKVSDEIWMRGGLESKTCVAYKYRKLMH